MNRLAGKTAIVTGAGRGIGQAIARSYAAEGAKVILISRNPDSCGSAASAINAEFPGSCKAFPCDVADAAAVEACIKDILAEYPAIDILVNNAGITKDGLLMRMKESDWDAVITTNLKSVFLFVKALQRTLMKSPAGRIINISSIVGITGNVGQSNYSASKAGGMTDAIPEKAREALLSRIPLADLGKPEDIAHAATFLASDEARYITGQVLVVDGGMTM